MLFFLYQVRARTLKESLAGSKPSESAWDSAQTLCVIYLSMQKGDRKTKTSECPSQKDASLSVKNESSLGF